MIIREELAGVRVDNCSLRDALRKVETYLNNERLNTVEAITMKTIVAAGENEEVRQCLEELDLVFPADRDILQSLNIASEQRLREVQEHTFFHEFMKRVQRSHRSVFLMTETQAQMEQLTDYLKEVYSDKIRLCGGYVIEECMGDVEDVVNEINSVMPHVILSLLPTPMQENFIYGHRKMLNAKVWFGIGEDNAVLSVKPSPRKLYRKLIVRRKMKQQIQNYETTDDGE